MQFGLKKIILVDRYVEGRVAQFDVSGHTNVIPVIKITGNRTY
jgi:hypothetical protein